MQEVFHDFDFVIAYMDDVIIFSRTDDDHLQHLKQVFQRLAEKGSRIKVSKCEFIRTGIHLLSHIITTAGIRTDPEKIGAIQRYPIPQNPTELRRFLGMTSYYRRFIRGFASIAKPLYELTSPRTRFMWQAEQDAAFLF